MLKARCKSRTYGVSFLISFLRKQCVCNFSVTLLSSCTTVDLPSRQVPSCTCHNMCLQLHHYTQVPHCAFLAISQLITSQTFPLFHMSFFVTGSDDFQCVRCQGGEVRACGLIAGLPVKQVAQLAQHPWKQGSQPSFIKGYDLHPSLLPKMSWSWLSACWDLWFAPVPAHASKQLCKVSICWQTISRNVSSSINFSRKPLPFCK